MGVLPWRPPGGGGGGGQSITKNQPESPTFTKLVQCLLAGDFMEQPWVLGYCQKGEVDSSPIRFCGKMEVAFRRRGNPTKSKHRQMIQTKLFVALCSSLIGASVLPSGQTKQESHPCARRLWGPQPLNRTGTLPASPLHYL